jgi:hypothetical protein
LSKLLHRSKFGVKGICPQITQIHADTEKWFEQGNAEGREFLSVSSVPSCSKKIFICVNLRQSAGNSGFGRGWPRRVCCAFWRLNFISI